MTATATPQAIPAVSSAKQQFLDAFEMEYQTTMRVLRAYPRDKVELKPAPVLKSARELAWMFVGENALCEAVLTDSLAIPPGPMPPAPESYDAILQMIEATHVRVADLVRDQPDHTLAETFRFYVGPKTLGDVPKIRFLWMMLSDGIHHRGQFSIYMRMAGGIVPSIYGPTLEEPWF